MNPLVKTRCSWCGTDPLYVQYHDQEWGVPVRRDQELFAKLCLDGFQAGLSWITILRKRAAFERAFHGFDPQRVAQFGDAEVGQLLANPTIVRSKAKCHAVIGNARAYLRLDDGAFSELLWRHVGREQMQPRYRHQADVPPGTKESEAMSRELL